MANRRVGGGGFGRRSAGRVPLGRTGARLLSERMRPLFTANGHGVCPVYCIKFDQTGQYIFTGADDTLVKVSMDGVPGVLVKIQWPVASIVRSRGKTRH